MFSLRCVDLAHSDTISPRCQAFLIYNSMLYLIAKAPQSCATIK
tara:strand:- start:46 stop:177 length:132 start_codon:yes stop_codon:yes gene_type:complete